MKIHTLLERTQNLLDQKKENEAKRFLSEVYDKIYTEREKILTEISNGVAHLNSLNIRISRREYANESYSTKEKLEELSESLDLMTEGWISQYSNYCLNH